MRVFIGPANSGKTERIVSLVAGAIRGGRRARLIVPSTSAANVLESRLASSLGDLGASAPVQTITTFPGFYHSLLREQGRAPLILHPVERDRLLRSAVAGLAESGSLSYFNETADRPGLVSAIASFIDELWRSGTGPEEFARVAMRRGKKDKDIAAIFHSYASELDSIGAVDSEGAGFAASELLRKKVEARRSTGQTSIEDSNTLVAVDGFDFYTPVQVLILKSLAASGGEVAVTLSYEAGSAVHLWHQRTRARLEEAGAEIIEYASARTDSIGRAAALLMKDEIADADLLNAREGPIHIISAPDRAAEVRAAAREIKRLVLKDGFRTGEIAIACRSLASYSDHLDRVFGECSIPLKLDCAKPLAEIPVVMALLRLSGLSLRLFSRRATVESLRSPYFDLSAYGLDESSVDRLDRISIERNVTSGHDQWLKAISDTGLAAGSRRRLFDHEEEDDGSGPNRERYEALYAGLTNFFDGVTPPRRATRLEHARWVLGLIERINVANKVAEGEFAARDKGALDQFTALIRIVGGDNRAAARHGLRQAQPDLSWPQFYDELERAIAGETFERPASAGPAVVAQEVHHLRPLSSRALFVMGLIEGEFPAKVAESAPYTLVERDELRGAGVDLTELPTDAGADLTQFYKAMARAGERLYLSFSRTDPAGGELLPSYLIEEVKAVAAVTEERVSQALPFDLSQAPAVASLEELALRAARSVRPFIETGLSKAGLDRPTRDAVNLLNSKLKSWPATIRGASVEHRRLRRERGGVGGFISSRDLVRRLDERFGPGYFWNASQINDYGSCPFRFFAGTVLRLTAAFEPGEGFAPNQLGSAYHQILEKLYSLLERDEIDLTSETVAEAAARAAEIAEEILESKQSSGEIRKSSFWEFEKAEIKKRVARLLQKEAEWNAERPARPSHFERAFGMKGNPPLVIESDDVEVRLCGIIDRIDECDEGSVVIDYKTSRTPISYRDALEGRNLQLPIYVMAASRVVTPGARVASAYYLHINSRKKGSEVPRKGGVTLDEFISQAERRIVDYVARARGGQFPVAPNGGRCYPGCEFDVMCRIQSLGVAADDDE
jgi:ATP-dependent helicase/nuclease subunit B